MKIDIVQKPISSNLRYKKNEKKDKIGYMQHSTGAPGKKAVDFIKAWDSVSAKAETEFIIDDTGIYQLTPLNIRTWHCGGSGNNTHVGCEICEPQDTRLLDVNWLALSRNGKNNTKWAVTQLQKELMAWGYDPKGIDGNFGPGCESAVKQFQADHNLYSDGSVGKATLHELQKRKGSFLLYNNVANQDYFEDVYRKAVYTCAYILKQLNVQNADKNSVLSHAEGYKLGIASNHADVGHWFPKHGKTMDDFRNDVKIYINSGLLPYAKYEEEIEAAWNKVGNMGLFNNIDITGDVDFKQFAVVLDRLNLLE